ncbi:MAG: hypothetical protein AAF957_22830 [Planctomycetota bacterium]
MLLQTQISNDNVVGVTTSYGTNAASDSSSGLLDWLFPLASNPLPVGVLIIGALVVLAVVRRRRPTQEP